MAWLNHVKINANFSEILARQDFEIGGVEERCDRDAGLEVSSE